MSRVLFIVNRSLASFGGFGDRVIALWGREPVVITGLATALVDAAIAFGAPITDEQKTAVIALFSALGVLVARSQVTPVSGATQ